MAFGETGATEAQPRGSVWRAGATAPELDEVRAIDVEMAELANQRAVLANRRMRIINRACHREEYRRKNIYRTGESC